MATYQLREDGTEYDTCEAADLDAAEAYARKHFDASAYDTTDGTVWVDIRIVNADDDGDEREITFTINPKAPRCTRGAHDFQSPHAIVGGLEENPGVWGHGGGVKTTEVCMHCGCGRHTDTWAQRPDTGEQGLESLRYVPGEFAEQVEALTV